MAIMLKVAMLLQEENEMPEEIRRGLCGICANHCMIGVRVRDDELVGIEPLLDRQGKKERGQSSSL